MISPIYAPESLNFPRRFPEIETIRHFHPEKTAKPAFHAQRDFFFLGVWYYHITCLLLSWQIKSNTNVACGFWNDLWNKWRELSLQLDMNCIQIKRIIMLCLLSVFTPCCNTKSHRAMVPRATAPSINRRLHQKLTMFKKPINKEIALKDQTGFEEGGLEPQRASLGWLSDGWALVGTRKGCRTGSVVAYVRRVIKLKDLQFSPGPLTASHTFRNYLEWFTRRQKCQPA